ncbi:hypothetical protein [Prevotella corporis]|uniref:hypothetical protein n=1 Tax=Prevotella corporis TaxID=28128 RepID=UPI00236699F2|nr:hypothetical protein [Prevotella corporis]
MRKIIAYSTILILSLSCKSQQFNVAYLCGTFDGVEGGKNPLSTYVLLELNMDNTCSLKKTFDLSKIECRGEWAMRNDGVIEIRCNNNPVLSDIEKALQGGSYIEGTLKIKVLGKNKLKLGNTVLKRYCPIKVCKLLFSYLCI